MKLAAAWLALALTALSAPAFAFPVTVLQQAGPPSARFNVAILGDGYRASDQAKLTSDATALVDAVFDAVPYKPYRQLFNFKVIQSVSVDQGAKGGSAGGTPNTLFSAYFDCGGVAQLVCLDDSAVLSAAATDVPEFNLAVVVVNDDKYGGAGGGVPCVSTAPESAEILRHELGHNLANLADEYTSPYPGYPACSVANDCSEPNVTLRSARAQIKWLEWIADSTPVPTPAGKGFTGVGLFEGARYMTTGFYRPVDTACKMQSLGQPFCPVCAEALVRSFWNLSNVHLIDEAVPAADVQSTTCVAQTFSVENADARAVVIVVLVDDRRTRADEQRGLAGDCAGCGVRRIAHDCGHREGHDGARARRSEGRVDRDAHVQVRGARVSARRFCAPGRRIGRERRCRCRYDCSGRGRARQRRGGRSELGHGRRSWCRRQCLRRREYPQTNSRQRSAESRRQGRLQLPNHESA